MSQKTQEKWVVAGMNSGGTKNTYHTDRDCTRLQSAKSPRKIQPGEIEFHDLEECKFCAGTAHKHGEFELKTCPFCGEQHKELCYHYPKCEEKP